MESMEYLNEDAQKKEEKAMLLYTLGSDDQITTSAKLLDIMYESYGFSRDLIETIN